MYELDVLYLLRWTLTTIGHHVKSHDKCSTNRIGYHFQINTTIAQTAFVSLGWHETHHLPKVEYKLRVINLSSEAYALHLTI